MKKQIQSIRLVKTVTISFTFTQNATLPIIIKCPKNPDMVDIHLAHSS